jgi:hypothetical protein
LEKNPDENSIFKIRKVLMKPASFVYFLIISPGYGLILSTYNIWNTMFNWQIRKLRVLEMVRQINDDKIYVYI